MTNIMLSNKNTGYFGVRENNKLSVNSILELIMTNEEK